MKKIILSTVGLCLLATVSFCQINIGAKAGINASNVTASGGGTSTSYSSIIRLNVGAFAEIPIAESFIIQPEVAYSGMGAKNAGSQSNLSYLDITALAKYMISNFGVYAGPQLGFLLSAKDKSSGMDIKPYLKSSDFAAVVGVEYNFEVPVVVSARYQFGLANIDATGGGGTVKNNAFTATVGYKFVNNRSTKK